MHTVNYDCYGDKNLTLEMKGHYFNDGFDLYETVSTLNSLQIIFDRAYLTITERSRITKYDRDIYRVKATEFRRGSFVADIAVYMCSAAQIAIPIFSYYSPSFLWDTTKEAFTYLKTVLSANKEGKGISLKNDGDGNVNIQINGSNNTIIVTDKAFRLANKAFDEFTAIAKKVDGENIESINLFSKDTDSRNDSIYISTKEKEIFCLEPIIDEFPIKIRGKIFRIDTHAISGKLVVTSAEDKELEDKEFTFELLNEKDIIKCCREIEKEVSFIVLKKVVFDPIQVKNTVKSLKIVSLT